MCREKFSFILPQKAARYVMKDYLFHDETGQFSISKDYAEGLDKYVICTHVYYFLLASQMFAPPRANRF
jgi:hypothetical protein